jgi:hypothetical protein
VSVWLPSLVGEQPSLAPLAYDFVLKHWQVLAQLAGDGGFGRHWLLPGALNMSSDPEAARRMVADQQRLDGAAGDSTAQQVLATVQNRDRLRQREAAALARALSGWAPR